jgi:hypothetical protein
VFKDLIPELNQSSTCSQLTGFWNQDGISKNLLSSKNFGMFCPNATSIKIKIKIE